MYNSPVPPKSELPTSAQLLKSTLVAAGVAATLLVTVVLPSEYNIDPTGVGKALGLKQMGEIKSQLAEEAEADRQRSRSTGPVKPTASGQQSSYLGQFFASLLQPRPTHMMARTSMTRNQMKRPSRWLQAKAWKSSLRCTRAMSWNSAGQPMVQWSISTTMAKLTTSW